MNVVENNSDMTLYLNEKFTLKGVTDFSNLASTMARLYHESPEEKYPIKIGIIFGIPLFHYNNEVKNKDEMSGRLKLLSQLLGMKEVHFESGGQKLILELGDI